MKETNKRFPIGRACGSLLGAVLTVGTGVLSPERALGEIRLGVLSALFGFMIVIGQLEYLGVLDHLSRQIEGRESSAASSVLLRLCLVSAFLSALLTNDTACLVLTPMAARLCVRRRFPLSPFLIALATSSNIGSASTLVGNPQNILISQYSGLGFGHFVACMGIICSAGVLCNYVFLILVFPLDSLAPSQLAAPSIGSTADALADITEQELPCRSRLQDSLAEAGGNEDGRGGDKDEKEGGGDNEEEGQGSRTKLQGLAGRMQLWGTWAGWRRQERPL